MKNKYSSLIFLLWCMGAMTSLVAMQQKNATNNLQIEASKTATHFEEHYQGFLKTPLFGFESENDLVLFCIKLRALEKCDPNDLHQLATGQTLIAEHLTRVENNIENSIKRQSIFPLGPTIKMCSILDTLRCTANKNFINLAHSPAHQNTPLDSNIKAFLAKFPKNLTILFGQIIDRCESLFTAGIIARPGFAPQVKQALPSDNEELDHCLRKLEPSLAKRMYFQRTLLWSKNFSPEYIQAICDSPKN